MRLLGNDSGPGEERHGIALVDAIRAEAGSIDELGVILDRTDNAAKAFEPWQGQPVPTAVHASEEAAESPPALRAEVHAGPRSEPLQVLLEIALFELPAHHTL